MALVSCRECGHQVSDQAAACPSCGAPVAGQVQHQQPAIKPQSTGVGCLKAALILAAIAVGLFVVFAIVMGNDPDAQARAKERDAIEYCEGEYQKLKDNPNMTRGALGLAYDTCEKMKNDFRSKWQREP